MDKGREKSQKITYINQYKP